MAAPEIVTEGTGWHEQLADRADLDLSYEGTGRTRADAVRELGDRVAAAEPHLAHPAVLVRHRQLWVHDEWRGDRVVGCRATQQISLRITDVAALEEVLPVLVGTEPAGLNGPQWLLDDQAAAVREAQRTAVGDARRRAEGYAEVLGGRLGPLLLLSETPDHGGVVMQSMAKRDVAGGPPDVRQLSLDPEPVRVSVHCTTRWTLITEG